MRRASHRFVRDALATALATAVVATLAVLSAPPAHAAPCPTKCYSAVLAPAEYTAGSTLAFSMKVTNLTAPGGQLVGSINVTPPSGFTVTSVDQPAVGSAAVSGNVVQLRNLALAGGQSATYTWTAQTPPGEGTYSWLLAAKQSNDFHGVGNEVVLDPTSSSTTTKGTSGGTSCTGGTVSCGTNFITYSKESAVSTGSVVNETVWHVGTTSFPATTATGGQLYSMVAKQEPDKICLGQRCAFQMNIDDIPAQYVGRPATLTLLVHSSKGPSNQQALLMFKQIEGGAVQTLPPCALSLGQSCFEYTRTATADLVVTVRNLHPGDPKIAGMYIP